MNCPPEFCPKCHDKKQKDDDTAQHPHNVNSSSEYFWCAKCLVESTGFGAYLDILIHFEHYNFIRSDKNPDWVTDEHWYCENCDHFLTWDNYKDGEGNYR